MVRKSSMGGELKLFTRDFELSNVGEALSVPAWTKDRMSPEETGVCLTVTTS